MKNVESVTPKMQALRVAKDIGCSGAHLDKNDKWNPCSSPDELDRISTMAEGSKWRSVVPNPGAEKDGMTAKRKRRRDGGWERLRERPVMAIETLPGGGLVSGTNVVGVKESLDTFGDAVTAFGGGIIPSITNGYKPRANDAVKKSGKAAGPDYVRDNDPNVFMDIESARQKAREMGCIGVSRRVSKTGRAVWMPCTNMSDYANRAGSTDLGRHNMGVRQQRNIENAVRTVMRENAKKKPLKKQ